jgi:DNA invertase Pin-like site-specific DNA recombinase
MLSNVFQFRPRHPDGVLRIAVVRRESTSDAQRKAIAESQSACETLIRQQYDGEIQFTRHDHRGSGWRAESAAMEEVRRLVEEELIDAVVAADVSRPFRNPRLLYEFVHLCKSHDVRLICQAEGLDTADPIWEILLSAAVIRQSMRVPQTRRVRKTLMKPLGEEGDGESK